MYDISEAKKILYVYSEKQLKNVYSKLIDELYSLKDFEDMDCKTRLEEFFNLLSNDKFLEKTNAVLEELTEKKYPNPKIMFEKTTELLDEMNKEDKDEEV